MIEVVNRIKTEMAVNLVTTVFFDWDHTLAAILGGIPLSGRLKALFQQEQIIYSLADIETALQAYEDGVIQKRITGRLKPQTEAEIMYQYEEILRYLGYANISSNLLHRLYNGYAHLPTFLYEDTLSTLRLLQERTINLGIISNHTPLARQMMQSHLSEFVKPESIFISGEMGVHKPDRQIFDCALTHMNVSAKECIFVGDDLFVDAIGAVQQGGMLLGLWLDRSDNDNFSKTLPPCVKRITSLKEVLAYV